MNPNRSEASEDTEGGLPEATIETSIKVVRVGRRARSPFLRQIEGLGAPKKFILNRAEMVIGRDERADIALPSANVSRQHALIQCRPHEVVLQDKFFGGTQTLDL